jgi:hypothetical protein
MSHLPPSHFCLHVSPLAQVVLQPPAPQVAQSAVLLAPLAALLLELDEAVALLSFAVFTALDLLLSGLDFDALRAARLDATSSSGFDDPVPEDSAAPLLSAPLSAEAIADARQPKAPMHASSAIPPTTYERVNMRSSWCGAPLQCAPSDQNHFWSNDHGAMRRRLQGMWLARTAISIRRGALDCPSGRDGCRSKCVRHANRSWRELDLDEEID